VAVPLGLSGGQGLLYGSEEKSVVIALPKRQPTMRRANTATTEATHNQDQRRALGLQGMVHALQARASSTAAAGLSSRKLPAGRRPRHSRTAMAPVSSRHASHQRPPSPPPCYDCGLRAAGGLTSVASMLQAANES